MIGIVDVEIQAANPQMPLYPMRAFVNSPSSVRVRNVPTEVGAWKITSVRVVVAYPDSSIKTADCVLAGSVWVATVAGCAVSGKTENGFTVFASGVDENGDAVSNYCLGKGAVEILQADGTLSPDAPSYYVHLFDEAPTAPNEGDMWPTADGFVIWQDGEAHALGGSSITIDTALSTTSENPVQNKVVSKALYTGFTEWECDSIASGYTFVSCVWDDYMGDTGWICTVLDDNDSTLMFYLGSNQEATSLSFDSPSIVITRHLITPTKTSQLTNDGAPNGGGTPYATTAQIPDVTGKADKAVPSAAGNLASLNAQGNLVDSGVKPSDFAAKADLPYALVTPGEWEFSGDGYDPSETYRLVWDTDQQEWQLELYTGTESPWSLLGTVSGEQDDLVVEFTDITATRASLPGHLCDRAGNLVVVSGDTTLTLPAANPGYIRDFLVRLAISGSTVPTITFQGQGSEAPNGADEITYETDGDEFPVPDEAGTWSYSFTENCVAHKFAVSLKKVNVVTQGGS